MRRMIPLRAFAFFLFISTSAVLSFAQSASSPVTVFVNDRTRVDSWQWFAAPPKTNSYAYVESLLRLGITQRIRRWDWQLEVSQPAILNAPGNSISPIPAQGQLGLGAWAVASRA